MRLTPYQIVAPFISLIAVFYAWNLAVRRKKSVLEAILWTIFWGSVTVVALRPNIVSYLSDLTGIENQESAVIVTFVGVLFFMVFYLVIRLEELEQKHAKIVRALALREAGLEARNNVERKDGSGMIPS